MKAAGLLALAFALTVTAQDPGDIAQLRRELDEMRSSIASTDRLSDSISVHGFVSQGWLRSDDNNWLVTSDDGSFDFSETGLTISAALDHDIKVGMQLICRNLGDYSSGGVEVDWAYGDYNRWDWLGVRAGRVKVPVGQYNMARDVDAARNPVFLPQSVYSESFRDVNLSVDGLSLYGAIPSEAGNLLYQAWLGGKPFPDGGSVAKINEDAGLMDVDDVNVGYAGGAALEWQSPIPGFRLTGSYQTLQDLEVSGATTPQAFFALGIPAGTSAHTTAPKYDMGTLGMELSVGNLTFAAERQTQKARFTWESGGVDYTVIPANSEGFYGWLDYQVSPQWSVGAVYSEFYRDAHDKDGDGFVMMGMDAFRAWQKDWSVYARVNLTESCCAKIEYHWVDGVAQLFAADNPDFDRHWQCLALKLTYTF